MRRDWLIVLVLMAVTLGVYWRVGQYEFINYDDPDYVTANPVVQKGLTSEGLAWAFGKAHAERTYWHPVTWLSHMLDCQLFGLKAGAHHLVNVGFHVLNAVLLFLLLKAMTQSPWRSALVAALFALHPLQVDTVAWVTERKNVLSTLFWLLTTGAYVRYAARPAASRYLLVALLFAVGLMTKPMLVTLPCALLLLDFWPLQRAVWPRWFGAPPVRPASGCAGENSENKGTPLPGPLPAPSSRGEGMGPRAGRASAHGPATTPGADSLAPRGTSGERAGERGSFKSNPNQAPHRTSRYAPAPVGRLVAEKLPLLALSVVSSLLTMLAHKGIGMEQSVLGLSLLLRVENALVSYARYIGKTIWPADLCILYPHPGVWAWWKIAGAGLLLVLITVLAWRRRRDYPYLTVGWFWFLGTLVPAIGIVQVGIQAMADRFAYVPVIGLLVMMVWGAADFFARRKHGARAAALAAGTVLAACLVVTSLQLRYWKNSITLFQHTVQVTTRNYPANNNLALALLLAGRPGEALDYAREAARLMPQRAEAHLLLGWACQGVNKPEEAIASYTESIRLNPEQPGALKSLGTLLAGQGKFTEAAGQYRKALKYSPEDAPLHLELAQVLLRSRAAAEAVTHYREALRLKPDWPEALNNLAWLLATDPSAEIRDGAEAVRLAERACDLTRRQQAVFVGTLAAAYAEAGRFADAVKAGQEAHGLAVAAGNQELAKANEKLLALYRAAKPYREGQ